MHRVKSSLERRDDHTAYSLSRSRSPSRTDGHSASMTE
jgi:hypothetical protein